MRLIILIINIALKYLHSITPSYLRVSPARGIARNIASVKFHDQQNRPKFIPPSDAIHATPSTHRIRRIVIDVCKSCQTEARGKTRAASRLFDVVAEIGLRDGQSRVGLDGLLIRLFGRCGQLFGSQTESDTRIIHVSDGSILVFRRWLVAKYYDAAASSRAVEFFDN